MAGGLNSMQDLDAALSKSLDEIINDQKKERTRQRQNTQRRGNRTTGRKESGTNFMNRNRYSAEKKQPTKTNNNTKKSPNKPKRGPPRTNGRSNIKQQAMKRPVHRTNNTIASTLSRQFGVHLEQRKPRNSPLQARRERQSLSATGTVNVSDLLPHVTSDDIKEIFETVGVVVRAYVNFDGKTGKSTGNAEIVYANRNDARKAQRELNGKLIDGAPVTVRLANHSLEPIKMKHPPRNTPRNTPPRKKLPPNQVPKDPPNPLRR